MISAIGTPLRAQIGRSSKFAHGDDEDLVQNVVPVQVTYERGDQVVEQGQQRTKPFSNAAVGWNVIAVSIPRPRGGMVAEIKCDKTDPGLDQATGK